MLSYKIAVIPGDGIGKEVIPAGLKVLRAVAGAMGTFRLDTVEYPWGCEHYLETGQVMPPDGLNALKAADSIYFGSAGLPSVFPPYLAAWQLIFVVRHAFDQYVNHRPYVPLPGVPTPIASERLAGVDFVVVRENTEGEFAGPGGVVHAGHPHAVAIQTSVFTRHGVERIARYSFELARRRRGHVTNVTKSNAVQHGLFFWDQVIDQVRTEYPDIEYDSMYADVAAMKLVLDPQHFDVLVTTNLYGDILSHLAGTVMGSIGLGGGGNINPERSYPSMFEPSHGTAPDIAGQGIANPVGAIWAGAMMLEHLGEAQAAGLVLQAVREVLKHGVKTKDLGGSASTAQMGDAIAAKAVELSRRQD